MRMRHSRNSRNLIPAKYPKNWPSRNSRNFGPAKIKAFKIVPHVGLELQASRLFECAIESEYQCQSESAVSSSQIKKLAKNQDLDFF